MDNDGTEYLWQGDEKYWSDRAPNLFPYIARMTKGQYKFQGKTYHMDIHGFAKDMIFKAEQISNSHIVFSITHTEETYAQYPFQFCFSIIYKLEGSKLSITYYVRNDDLLVTMAMFVNCLFPSIARFEATIKQIFKNCFVFTVIHLPWALLAVLVLVVAIVIVYLSPITIVCVPTLYMICESKIYEHIFKKYIKEKI